MCNVDEDNQEAHVAPRNKLSTRNNKCVKCDQQGVVVIRIHDSFCTECFRVYIVHKFRSAIGKSKLIRDGEKVLVAFSGGSHSAALLHLISDGLSLRAHKKLRFIPTLIHVDEFTVLENYGRKRLEIQQEISQMMVHSGFESYITCLEQGLDQSQHEGNSGSKSCGGPTFWEASSVINMLQEPSISDVERLKSVFSGFSSLSCKEDFLRNFRNRLIVSVARKLGFDKVLTAECSSRLSVRILTDIAQGRGSQVFLDTGFSDSRHEDVMFVRPIRDLTSKEVVMYNTLFHVASVFRPSLTTKAMPGASIEHLTESFVTGLQADFPSTTSNIIRTSEKLSQSSEENAMKCSICNSFLDTSVAAASALNAIEFSKNISHFGRGCEKGIRQDQKAVNTDCVNIIPESSRSDNVLCVTDIIPQLCFGCRLSVRDFSGDIKSLPFIQVQEQSESEHNKKNMKGVDSLRDQIADFLIDENENSSSQ